MTLAHDVFSVAMVALFILIFSRGVLAFTRAMLRITGKNRVYAVRWDGFVTKTLSILAPIVAIYTSLVCLGVIAATVMTGSLATIMEFYIVYAGLQFCFTFFMVAFDRLPLRMLLAPFVEIFYAVHMQTYKYLVSFSEISITFIGVLLRQTFAKSSS
ncbi:MAG TPA: hypothetical protein VI483_00040 [Candidatus Paceibacterota bacterium]